MTRQLYGLCGQDRNRPFSPHVWKIVLALAHKGLECEMLPVSFTTIPTIENGATKTVPLLRDGERLIRDSFAIALYLEETYPDRPSLFGGKGGEAMARFVESWSQMVLHTALVKVAVLDIHNCLAPADQAYFRQSREARFGRTLEEVVEAGQADFASFAPKLEPLRTMLKFQPFIGGEAPLFCDYIVFGALQWTRITTKTRVLDAGDPVTGWFERCLDLYDGLGRSVTAA